MLRGRAAKLELALCTLAMQRIEEYGFELVMTPDLVRTQLLDACGFQPRGNSTQIYRIEDYDLCLTGTAEVPLAGLMAGESIDATTRLGGLGHCFRTEAGALGRDDYKLYRMHQFTKVEMYSCCAPGDSEAEHAQLVDIHVGLCESLELQYRVLDMPTEELGASAYRKMDVEVWLPGLKRWGEVASVTNCADFQARRLSIRMRKTGEFAHTLNGTALAVPRIMLALAETHQDDKGVVRLPRAVADLAGFDVLNSSA